MFSVCVCAHTYMCAWQIYRFKHIQIHNNAKHTHAYRYIHTNIHVHKRARAWAHTHTHYMIHTCIWSTNTLFHSKWNRISYEDNPSPKNFPWLINILPTGQSNKFISLPGTQTNAFIPLTWQCIDILIWSTEQNGLKLGFFTGISDGDTVRKILSGDEWPPLPVDRWLPNCTTQQITWHQWEYSYNNVCSPHNAQSDSVNNINIVPLWN